MKLTVQEILEDLHAAENDCQMFEKKYGNPDFALWAGAYGVKLDCEAA